LTISRHFDDLCGRIAGGHSRLDGDRLERWIATLDGEEALQVPLPGDGRLQRIDREVEERRVSNEDDVFAEPDRGDEEVGRRGPAVRPADALGLVLDDGESARDGLVALIFQQRDHGPVGGVGGAVGSREPAAEIDDGLLEVGGDERPADACRRARVENEQGRRGVTERIAHSSNLQAWGVYRDAMTDRSRGK